MLQGCFMLRHSLLHLRVSEIRAPEVQGIPSMGKAPLISHFLYCRADVVAAMAAERLHKALPSHRDELKSA